MIDAYDEGNARNAPMLASALNKLLPFSCACCSFNDSYPNLVLQTP